MPIRSFPRVPLDIVGGSVGCLVAALTAARGGRSVRLYMNPARAGGSFAGLAIRQRRLNLGVRLFELDYEDSAETRRPISTFDPERDNHRPFIDAVAATLRDLLADDLVPATTPELWLSGRRGQCIHFTADVSQLSNL